MSQEHHTPIDESPLKDLLPYLKAIAIAVFAWITLYAIEPSTPITGSYGLEFVYTILVLTILATLVGAHRTILEYRSVVGRSLAVVGVFAVLQAVVVVGFNASRGVYWNLETVATNIERPVDYLLLHTIPGDPFILFVAPVLAVIAAWYWTGPSIERRGWVVGTVSLAVVLAAEIVRTALQGLRWYVYHLGLGNDVTLPSRVVYHMARDLRPSVLLFATAVVVLTGVAVGVSKLREKVR